MGVASLLQFSEPIFPCLYEMQIQFKSLHIFLVRQYSRLQTPTAQTLSECMYTHLCYWMTHLAGRLLTLSKYLEQILVTSCSCTNVCYPQNKHNKVFTRFFKQLMFLRIKHCLVPPHFRIKFSKDSYQ